MTSINFKKIQRVLVAKLRHHGDVLLSSPVFSVLKNRYPHLVIDAYLYSETLPMLEGHPAISDFILYEKKWKKLPFWRRYFYEMQLLHLIRKKRYDLVINLTEGDRGAIAAKVSKAPFAVGFDPDGMGLKGKASCYTHMIRHTPRPRHTVEKQLDALRSLGLFPSPLERELTFVIPQSAYAMLSSLPVSYVVIHPVSRWMFKTLPVETVIAIARYFEEQGETVVLTASPDPDEIEMNRQIASSLKGAIDLSGKITLKELGALIEKSRFLFTVDSVPFHMASVFKKATAAVFGPTCEMNWGPYRNPNALVITNSVSCRPCYQKGCGGAGRSDCLDSLTPEAILSQLHPFYNSKSSPK